MRSVAVVVFPLVLLSTVVSTTGAMDLVTFVPGADDVQIKIGDKPFATYVFRNPRIRRPYLAHVHAPHGVQVTRNHPPIAGQDATDHDTMHPGIWLAFGDLSGADFWRNKAEVKHIRFIETPKSHGNDGTFTVLNLYLSDGKVICRERCRLTICARPAGYLVLWDSTFDGEDDFYFGDQEELGLGVRVATPLAVANGGTLTNSEGLQNERQLWGKLADWCDYSGTIGGQPAGVLLSPDPGNFRRCWFHARDYGFVAANPFGRKAFTGREPSRVVVKEGEALRLRFAVLVHDDPIKLDEAYSEVLDALDAYR